MVGYGLVVEGEGLGNLRDAQVLVIAQVDDFPLPQGEGINRF